MHFSHIAKKIIHTAFVIGLVVGLFLQMTSWHSPAAGFILFGVYIVAVGWWWQQVFSLAFGIKKRSLVNLILSFFVVFVLLGLFEGICAVWYTLTPVVSTGVYAVVAAVSAATAFLIRKKSSIRSTDTVVHLDRKTCFRLPNSLTAVYGLLWLFGMWLLLTNRGDGSAIMSPWQHISTTFLVTVFIASILLGIMLYSQYKTTTLLVLIILHSVLMHAYIPFSHHQPWGGDVWRMIAVEERLLAGEFVQPVLFGSEIKTRDIFGWRIPEAFLIPNKYVYGQLWGSSVLVAQTLRIDLRTVNIWLISILWSLCMPILLYRIGKLLFGHSRYALWLSALSMILFSFQALGALTLAVSMGTLMFLFAFMLLIQYLRDREKQQLIILLFLAGLMVFSYTVHTLLFLSLLVASAILLHARTLFRSVSQRKEITLWKWVFGTIGFMAAVGFFPAIELIAGTSRITDSVDWFYQAKQLVGAASGWFFASAVRPYDITFFNILFNHMPDYAFVSNVFTEFRWHVFAVSIGAVCLSAIGLAYAAFKQRGAGWQLMALLASIVVGGYIVGWFVLEGDRSFVRRLDSVMAFLFLAFSMYGIATITGRVLFKKMSRSTRRAAAFIMIVLLSWVGTTTYASGPDMRVVSDHEYAAAKHVWSLQDQSPGCVLADTWVLLALEAVSAGKVVGGGFPIDYQFGQPERAALYSQLLKSGLSQKTLDSGLALFGFEDCWLVVSVQSLPEGNRSTLQEFATFEATVSDSILIYRYGLKKRAE